MVSEMSIRPAQPEDARAIAEIHVASWRGAYRGLIPQHILDGLDVAQRERAWGRIIRASIDGLPTEGETGPSLKTIVAESDGGLLGWCSFGPGRDEELRNHGEVAGIYADPAAWGTGAGFRLMSTATNALSEAGFTSAFLWVLDGNERAIGFYERNGWHDSGATKLDDFHGEMLRERRYERAL